MKLSTEQKKAVVAAAGVWARDLVGLGGLGMVVQGVAGFSVPAAWIVGGLACVGWALFTAWKAS